MARCGWRPAFSLALSLRGQALTLGEAGAGLLAKPWDGNPLGKAGASAAWLEALPAKRQTLHATREERIRRILELR